LIALFYEINAALERDLDNSAYAELKNDIFTAKDVASCHKIIEKFNDWFDKKRLTMIDTIKKYDSTNVEIENTNRGM
jgi:hypothetical protein